MEILKVIASSVIIGSLFILIVGMFINIKATRTYRVLVLLFTMSMSVFAYAFEPARGADLYRLQQYANSLRFSGDSFFQALFNAEGTLVGTSTAGMISFNLLCMVVRWLGDVHWLSTLSVLISMGVLTSLVVDFAISEGYSSRAIGWGIFLTFIGLQLQYVFSGVRNAMAVSYTLLGLYLLLYKNRRWIFPGILFLLAVTMHPIVLIIVPPVLLAKCKRQTALRLAALLAIPCIYMLAQLLVNVPVGFIQYAVSRIAFFEDTGYQFDRPEMIADILIFIATALAYWYLGRTGKIDMQGKFGIFYKNAYMLLGFIMLGCVVKRDFILRIGYIMGIASVPLVSKMLFAVKNADTTTNLIRVLLVVTLLACGAKVYYDTTIGILSWSFS